MRGMKTVMLGLAVTLIAVPGAQAAPVEYAKVCNLYGAGFWHVPGATDTCVKIGLLFRSGG
ncbi:MAG TPA: porin [Bradyrhizobium sp.]|nr:porin [Bradyrhizobium sp.]